MTARYLVHTSVLARLHLQDVLARVGALLVAGHVATHSLADLELLTAARSAEAHRAMRTELLALPHLPVTDRTLDRAIEVQGALAELGRHREVTPGALVSAAIAEHAGLVVLHHDAAFDVIAEVTGQPVDWVTPSS